MYVGERLQLFIDKCYGTQLKFAKAADINKNSLSRYILNKIMPGTDALVKFREAGMSIDWLLSGEGSMYAVNAVGDELRVRFEELKSTKIMAFDRLRTWVTENFDSLQELAKDADVDKEELYGVIYGNFLPDHTLLKGLRRAGCNIEWLFSGLGSKYENNIAGIKLKLKTEGIELGKMDENMLEYNISKALQENSSENLFSLIRQVVIKELEERESKMQKYEQ